MDKNEYFSELFAFIDKWAMNESKGRALRQKVNELVIEGQVQAAKEPDNKKYEEIFTYLYIGKAIQAFHQISSVRDRIGLEERQIRTGLAIEGSDKYELYGSAPGEGFSSLIKKSGGWRSSFCGSKKSGKLPLNHPCPDFGLKRPLPFTAVGDVKYVRNGEVSDLLRSLYESIREMYLYLGMINLGQPEPIYENAVLIVGDATEGNVLQEVIEKNTHRDFWARLNSTDSFYFKIVRA
jgi:hypothetical protein